MSLTEEESLMSDAPCHLEDTLKALFGGMHAIFPSGAIPLCIKNSMFIELEKVVYFVPVC